MKSILSPLVFSVDLGFVEVVVNVKFIDWVIDRILIVMLGIMAVNLKPGLAHSMRTAQAIGPLPS